MSGAAPTRRAAAYGPPDPAIGCPFRAPTPGAPPLLRAIAYESDARAGLTTERGTGTQQFPNSTTSRMALKDLTTYAWQRGAWRITSFARFG